MWAVRTPRCWSWQLRELCQELWQLVLNLAAYRAGAILPLVTGHPHRDDVVRVDLTHWDGDGSTHLFGEEEAGGRVYGSV